MIEATAKRWEHGSLTPLVKAWSARWIENRKRVLIFANFDAAGSSFRWAEAINSHTEWAARHVTVRPHPYGYACDLTYGAPARIDERFHELAAEADVIQLKDEAGFLDGRNRAPTDLLSRHRKPLVHLQYGGIARQRQDDMDYRRHVLSHDAVVALTPDLCFPWLAGRVSFIPHAIDVATYAYGWHDSRIIGHSPSTRSRKGTLEFEKAVARIPAVEVDIIEGVNHAEVIKRKSRVGVFFDQAGRDSLADGRVIGWYGNSALEAAVLGIPTLAHVSVQAIEGAELGNNPIPRWMPIVDTGLTSEGIEVAIRYVLDMDEGDRRRLSELTRRWVEHFHGYGSIGRQLVGLYEGL